MFYNRDLITPWILCGLFYFIKSLSNRCHVGNGIHLSLCEQKVLLNQYCKLQTPTFNNIKVRKFVCSLACGNANTTLQFNNGQPQKYFKRLQQFLIFPWKQGLITYKIILWNQIKPRWSSISSKPDTERINIYISCRKTKRR